MEDMVCPHCAETVKAAAEICRFCERVLRNFRVCSFCAEPVRADAKVCRFCSHSNVQKLSVTDVWGTPAQLVDAVSPVGPRPAPYIPQPLPPNEPRREPERLLNDAI